ncbi:MAG: hypothetical protein ACLFTK_01655 [Anaerolineales bacterium]
MSYITRWLQEPYVYYVAYDGQITLEAAVAVRKAVVPVLDNSAQTVHFLFDMQTVTGIAPSLSEMSQREEAADFYQHPRLGWIVYVSEADNTFVRFMTSALAQQYGARLRWYHSQADAVDFLREFHPNI